MATDKAGPKRIQRKRTKGWKMPPNTVYVGRPTKWGNPFKVWNGRTGFPSAENGSMPSVAVDSYRTYIEENDFEAESDSLGVSAHITSKEIRKELRGKDLACWCKIGQFCHADVLLEVANG